jgi:hypothetical protein
MKINKLGLLIYTRHQVMKRELNAKASTTQTYYIYYRIQKLTCFSPVISIVLHPSDSTGQTNYSRTLATLVRGFDLHGVGRVSLTWLHPLRTTVGGKAG